MDASTLAEWHTPDQTGQMYWNRAEISHSAGV